MYSIRDILNGYVKKETPQETSYCDQNGQMIPLNGFPAYLHRKTETPSGCNMFSHHWRASFPFTSAYPVPSLEKTSTQADFLKIQRSNVHETVSNENTVNDDLTRHEKIETSSACNMVGYQTTFKSTYPVPSLRKTTTQDDMLRIKRKNVQGTQSNKKAVNDNLTRHEKRETSSSCNMVGYQTTFKSTYPVPSLGKTSTQDDVLKIKISNVQGTQSNKKAVNDDLTRNEKRETSSSCNMVGYQTTFKSTYPVPSLGKTSTQDDVLRIKRKNVQGTQSNKKAVNDDLTRNEKRETSSACNMVGYQTTFKSTYPVPSLGKTSTQDDVLKIKISNVQGTQSNKKAVSDDLTRHEKRETSSSCNMVGYQTTSLPFESAYLLPSLGEINTQADVLKIKANNAFGDDLTGNQCHVTSREESNQNVKSICIQEEMPLSEQFCNEQLTSQKETYPEKKTVSSPINQSSVFNTNPSTTTAEQERDLSRYHLSQQTTTSTYQIRNQYPLPSHQMGTNGMMSTYQFDSQSGSSAIRSSYQIGTNIILPPDVMSSHKTVPLYHMGTMDEMTTSQVEDVEKNAADYQPETTSFLSGCASPDKQGMQYCQNQLHGIVTNPRRSASTCQCCCHAQAQSQSSHPTVFGLENRRPSVIMVPTSWSCTSSGESHVPLKVSTPYIQQSQKQMDYLDDSDSSDEDESREKYFRMNIDGKTVTFKLTKEDWKRIPINSFPSGGRLLSGDWIKIFLEKVKESNPWCSLRFKNNHVRSENSRKIHSAVFFRGGAECKRPECSVKVRFVIQKEKGKHVDVTYIGNVCHSSQLDGGGVRNYRNKNKQKK